MTQKLLKAGQVAATLGVTEKTVYQLAKAGKLATVKIGTRQFRFLEDGVKEYIERGRK